MKNRGINLDNIIMTISIVLSLLFASTPKGILYFYKPLENIENYILLFAFVIQILLLLIYSKDFKVQKEYIYIFIYVAVIAFVTIFNGGSLSKMVYEIIKIFIWFIWIRIAINRRDFLLFKVIFYSFLTLLLLNLFFINILPDGVYTSSNRYYFFDAANEVPNYVIPMAIYCFIYVYYTKMRKIFAYFVEIVCILSLLSLLLIDCSTGKVGVVCIFFFLLFRQFVAKTISWKIFWIVYISMMVLFVFLRLQNYFEFIIVDILGESLTFHTRTYAWDYAMEIFKQFPVLGQGYLAGIYKYSPLYRYTTRFSHAHSEFFEILLRSGIVGVFCFGMFLYKCTKRVAMTYKKEYFSQMVIFVLFVFLFMSVVETCFTHLFFLFMAMAFYSNDIIQILKNNHSN